MLYPRAFLVVARRRFPTDEPAAIATSSAPVPPKPPPASPTVWRAGLALALLLAGGPAMADRRTAPRPLLVGTPGGAMQDAMQKAFLGPFGTETGIAVRAVGRDGRLSAPPDPVHGGFDPADLSLVLMDSAEVPSACDTGALLPIDPAAIPGLAPAQAALVPRGTNTRCGIGAFRTSLVLAWDRSRTDSIPDWSDFWDVARRPGKRGLRRDPRGTLEIALLADGVAPDDLYRTLSTGEGLDRAFRKLDQLRPYIVWWDTPAQAVRTIESGAVLMTSAPSDAVAAADLASHRDFGIRWTDALDITLDWAMPAGAGAHPDQARRLLGFMLRPARQADFVARFPAADSFWIAPPATGTAQAADGSAAHRNETLPQDDRFWAAHLVAIRARFDGWIGG